jgi:hypothetical protein
MAKGISEFKSNLTNGGARPNLFLVRLAFPNLGGIADVGTGISSSSGLAGQAEFLIKTAQIPASSIGAIEVPYRGRMLKVAGDRTFEPWSVTVINDGKYKLRQAFEIWSRGINAHTENVAQLGYGADGGDAYCVDLTVFQLSRDGKTPNRVPPGTNTPGVDTGSAMDVVRAYKFFDAWPSSLSSIDLSYDANDQIEEFTVEFQYNFFEVTNSTL